MVTFRNNNNRRNNFRRNDKIINLMVIDQNLYPIFQIMKIFKERYQAETITMLLSSLKNIMI